MNNEIRYGLTFEDDDDMDAIQQELYDLLNLIGPEAVDRMIHSDEPVDEEMFEDVYICAFHFFKDSPSVDVTKEENKKHGSKSVVITGRKFNIHDCKFFSDMMLVTKCFEVGLLADGRMEMNFTF